MPTTEELRIMQAYPLDLKVKKSQFRIREWVNYYGVENCAVAFSGGKDSTVLLHIVRELYPDIEAVFCNTGLEYPEIQKFAKSFDNVTVLHPQMNFKDVVTKYGYPFISKEVAERVHNARRCLSGGGIITQNTIISSQERFPARTSQILGIGGFFSKRYDFSRWRDLLTLDFRISHLCCNEMKKKPFHKYKKKMFVATMTEESMLRRTAWLKTGCNAFNQGVSKPMSFWTEQDVLEYIKAHGLPIASVYGDIVYGSRDSEQYDATLCDCGAKLCTTGCQRTGCIFCGYGAHRDRGEGRFQRLKHTHPKLYDYCMGGGTYDTDGFWVPTTSGLGMARCIDELNRLYGKDFIKY